MIKRLKSLSIVTPLWHTIIAVLLLIAALLPTATAAEPATNKLFERENLVAWCIVPFDAKKRNPEQRAEMLERIGIKRLAYDYRAEHVPTFDAELAALKKHGIRLDAWWFPTTLNDEAKLILAVLQRHDVKTQLWVTGGGEPTRTPEEQARRVAQEAARIRPLAEAAAKQGCQVALYNHGGWFGEPENQLAILAELKLANVGIVYNLHHGHDHLERLPKLLALMKPHLLAVNLNGMTPRGDQTGQKILPLAAGDADLTVLKTIRDSGYTGPIGILNHTDHDAEARLLDNLDGLAWLLPQLDGQKPPAKKLKFRTYAKPAKPEKITGHWGEEAIGFRWTESDSVDGRWNDMEIGTHLACSLATPLGATAKGSSFRLGERGLASVCYDTATLTLRCGWTGGFIAFDPARFGLINMPRVHGAVQFAAPTTPAWGTAAVQYRGMDVHGARAVLEYTVDGATVRESPWASTCHETTVFERHWQFAPHERELASTVLPGKNPRVVMLDGMSVACVDVPDGVVAAVALSRGVAPAWQVAQDGCQLRFAPGKATTDARLYLAKLKPTELARFAAWAKQQAPLDIAALTQPGPRTWTKTLVTRGTVAADAAPYVVDTIALPFDNPYRALFFVGGHDFFLSPAAGSSPDAALCTVHGDVWLVRGLDERLERVTWQRFATGLFQPLGLRIVDNTVYVLGRDQITRLVDRNGDGEADRYECFYNAGYTSLGGHDYATCLETDRAGNFYYIRSGNPDGQTPPDSHGVTRVARDGRSHAIIATGLRNPNGLTVGPDDTITAAPQEGEWTPGSCLVQVRPGGHYGYGGPRVTPERPTGVDPPLAWIPRIVDNSSGAQAWCDSPRFGPLAGGMLHLSFGRCWALGVVRDRESPVPQGGMYKLPLTFASGVMRGRVRAADGWLYASGLKGWGTSAGADGCFQRVRYTGQKAHLPLAMSARANGVLVRFSEPLDRAAAEDADNYSAQQWNYKYSAAYGSAEWKVSTPKQEGREEVEIRSATLHPDGRTVFLEIPTLRPVQQLALQMALRAQDGAAVEHELFLTLNALPAQRETPGPHAGQPRPRDMAAEIVQRLQPGLAATFSATNLPTAPSATRPLRMAAWTVARGEPASASLPAGPFAARVRGYLKVPLRSRVKLQLEGTGTAAIRVNGQEVLRGRGEFASTESSVVTLRKGYNAVELDYQSAVDGTGRLRLLWSGTQFPAEPVPPTAWWYDPRDAAAERSQLVDRGREVFASRHCQACHELAKFDRTTAHMPELAAELPNLGGVAERFHPAWIHAWLLNPTKLRPAATMPAVLGHAPPEQQRETAADIVAYLLAAEDDHATFKPFAAPPQEPPVEKPAEKPAGESLYEDLGCIKCHTFAAPSERDRYDRMSLHFARAKYPLPALATYLRAPHRRHAATKMPDFALSPAEATALAEYVHEQAAGTLPADEPWKHGDARRGREAFDRAGCIQCHPVGVRRTRERLRGVTTSLTPERLAAPRGCLASATAERGRAPDFTFSAADRAALTAFLATDGRGLVQEHPAEASRRLVKSLRCNACHTRDQATTLGDAILIDEGSGRPPELLPSLTWAGEKLHQRWVERFLDGELSYRPRPWLHARMPAFHPYSEALARGLAAEHGMPERTPPVPAIDPRRVKIGEELTLKQRGLDCRQCHAPADEVLRLTNEAQGVGLAYIAERLRPEYYTRWMLDPTRIDPLARMPRFTADGRTTTAVQIEQGDARRQFEALWEYLRDVGGRKSEVGGRK